MATIPTYQRQVTSIATPNVRVQASGDSNAYGANVAQQFGHLGSLAVNRAEEMQAEDDRNLVIQAKSSLDNKVNSTLYDEKTGVMNQKGANALDITNRFNTDYDSAVKETSKNLKTQRQQDVFNQYVMGQKDNYLRSVSSHQARERQTYTEDNANVAITSAQNLAIANYADQSVFANSMATINKTIDSVYGYKGKEVTDSMKAKALSGIRAEQVTGMISQGQGIGARDFLIAHKNEIDPKQYDNLYAGAETKAAIQESKAVADDVFNRYGVDNEREGLNYLKSAYGNNAGYDRFEMAVKARYSDEKRLKREDTEKFQKTLSKQIDSAPTLQEALAIINGSDLTMELRNSVTRAVTAKFKALEEKPSKEQKFFASYEARGLYKDEELLDEYNKRIADGEEIPIKQQTRYNQAAVRLNNYQNFASGGAYNQAPQFSKDELKKHETDMWNAIEKLAESNVPQADIISKIKAIAPKYGFDPDYFITSTEWDKIGKIKGQYSN